MVDLGAFVDDSAIYFALRGAKRVIAIESHPGAYAKMLENIKLNNLGVCFHGSDWYKGCHLKV